MTWTVGQRVKVIFPAPEVGLGPLPLPPLEHHGKITAQTGSTLYIDLDDLVADIVINLKHSRVKVLPE